MKIWPLTFCYPKQPMIKSEFFSSDGQQSPCFAFPKRLTATAVLLLLFKKNAFLLRFLFIHTFNQNELCLTVAVAIFYMFKPHLRQYQIPFHPLRPPHTHELPTSQKFIRLQMYFLNTHINFFNTNSQFYSSFFLSAQDIKF